jgi:hypothetical protein
MSVILAEVFVPGRPRPKGSMRCMGAAHHMEEDNPESKPWRRRMAVALVGDRDFRRGGGSRDVKPYGLAVDVSVVAFFEPSGAAACGARMAPTSTYDGGDVDKLARNVLDALQDSAHGSPAVLADDSQVIGLFSEAVFTDRAGEQGIWIRVTTVEDAEVRRRRRLRNAALSVLREQLGMMAETGF